MKKFPSVAKKKRKWCLNIAKKGDTGLYVRTSKIRNFIDSAKISSDHVKKHIRLTPKPNLTPEKNFMYF